MVSKTSFPSLRLVVLLMICLSVAIFVFARGEAIYRTAFIVSNVVSDAPWIFELGKYEFKFEEVEFAYQNDRVGSRKHSVDVFLPLGEKLPPFVILIPGFTPEGAKDTRLVNLAETLAEAGIGVAVPHSATLRNHIFSFEDVERIKDTFFYLAKNLIADPERIGIMGFSVAGSYALVAASGLGEKLLFVVSIGGYFDLKELFCQVLSGEVVYKDRKRVWEPDDLSEEVVEKVLARQPGERRVEDLIAKPNLTFSSARTIIDSLPGDFLAELRKMSPSHQISGVKTRVFLLHDQRDDIIPVEESRKIRDFLPDNIPVYYSELSILRHVTPKTYLSGETLKFFRQVYIIVNLLI